MDEETIFDRIELACSNRDLSFFDTFSEEELYKYNAFLHQIAKHRWEEAIRLPKVQACFFGSINKHTPTRMFIK
jgi:hypothetical protein